MSAHPLDITTISLMTGYYFDIDSIDDNNDNIDIIRMIYPCNVNVVHLFT